MEQESVMFEEEKKRNRNEGHFRAPVFWRILIRGGRKRRSVLLRREKGESPLFVGYTLGRLVRSSMQKRRRRRGFSRFSSRRVGFGAAAPVINVPYNWTYSHLWQKGKHSLILFYTESQHNTYEFERKYLETNHMKTERTSLEAYW